MKIINWLSKSQNPQRLGALISITTIAIIGGYFMLKPSSAFVSVPSYSLLPESQTITLGQPAKVSTTPLHYGGDRDYAPNVGTTVYFYFYRNGEKISGSSLTNSEGIATFTFTPTEVGKHGISSDYTEGHYHRIAWPAEVEVVPAPVEQPPPSEPSSPLISFYSDPSNIMEGKESILKWSSLHADSCKAIDNWTGSTNISGYKYVKPDPPGKWYKIQCTGASGTTEAQTRVNVNYLPPTVNLKSSLGTIHQGTTIQLTWSTTRARECNADWTNSRAPNGTQDHQPGVTWTYKITCYGSGGEVSAETTVTVIPPPPPKLSPTPTATKPKRPAHCPEYDFMGARGSGERAGDYKTKSYYFGMGNIIYTAAQSYASHTSKRTEYFGVQYDAVPVVGRNMNGIGAFLHIPLLGNYDRSVNQGSQWIIDHMAWRYKMCQHHTKFILAGYSQGAQVVGNTIQDAPGLFRDLIQGTVLLADPKYNADSWARSEKSDKFHYGMLNPRGEYPADLKFHIISYCDNHDPVCGLYHYIWKLRFGFIPYKSYEIDPLWTWGWVHFTYANSGRADEAGKYLANRTNWNF